MIDNAIKNKIQGKVKQFEGGFNQHTGKGVKGGMQKIVGKVQEGMGNTQLNAKRQRPRNRNTI